MLPLGATGLPEVPIDSRDRMINNSIISDPFPMCAVFPLAYIHELIRDIRDVCGKRGLRSSPRSETMRGLACRV